MAIKAAKEAIENVFMNPAVEDAVGGGVSK
jgi:hypothetical protein